jgi:GT2 family glycosyltransferase
MSEYKISLFCSFYKNETFIEGYLENLLEQTMFKDIEFIFVDCNSPENEKKYILPLTKKYKNIIYYKLDQDPGLYGGWNYAIKKSKAKLVSNWNTDDRKSKEGMEFLYKAFEKDPELDVAYGITYISEKANEKYVDNNFGKIYPYLPHSFKNLMINNSPHCMPLWKKSIHDRYGFFDESYKSCSDGDMWLKAASMGAKLKLINHPIGLYYQNPNGRSTNKKNLKEMIEEVNDMRKKYTKYL